MLAGTEELSKMNELTMQNTISILRCPRFWQDNSFSRSKFLKGDVQNEKQWGYLYNMDCELCKLKNECKETCKHRSPCKLYVIKTEEGIVKVKRTNVNARLPSRGTEGAVGYDLGCRPVYSCSSAW